MLYLANTAHWQFLALIAGFLAWILTMTTIGLNDWRLWEVDDVSVISSGVAWVGIWRACFHSHVLPRMENCWSIGISDTFVPIEISVAQVMMMMAVISGLAGNIIAAVAMRMVYFSVKNRRSIRLAFVAGGLLYLLTATLCLVPLVWNMTSVLNNRTIDFPPEFHLPAAPVSQKVGSAIGVGICSSVLLLISGLVFLCYRYVWHDVISEASRDPLHGPWTVTTLPHNSELSNGNIQGVDNPAFTNENN
ncbi:claudin-17 [Stegastes partitus]|uniref:Claudin-17 n=1 Tax=Stegastes partitus TaxID=144197 RepID=A0A9Y4JZ11_9TELE|nr:PREDICTED: claudin-17 [Stegastes partitus]